MESQMSSASKGKGSSRRFPGGKLGLIKVEEEKNRDEKVPKREAVCAKIRQGLKEQSAAVWLELGGVYVCVGVCV